MKVLIDTNVILDALLLREPWARTAQDLLRAVAKEKFNGFITASQTTDIIYLLCRQGADESMSKSAIKTLTECVGVSDVTPTDVQNALTSDMTDYEDGLLACCAKRHKAEYIITRNENDFAKSPVPALSPQDFMQAFFSV